MALVISVNIFYFSRELLYKQLFAQVQLEPEIEPASIVQTIPSYPLLQSEMEILPDHIKNIVLKNQSFQQLQSDNPKTNEAVPSITPSEELFITSIQQAESLVDKKIQELQSKRSLRKADIVQTQQEIKEEVAKTLPEVPVTQWESWTPLTLHQKLLNLELYCEKCAKTVQLQQTTYEIEKSADHYEIVSVHDKDGEQHTTTAKVTLDTFEILAKPVVTIDPKQPKEVEA